MDAIGYVYILSGGHISFARLGSTGLAPDALFQKYSRLYTSNMKIAMVLSSCCATLKRQFATHFQDYCVQGNLYTGDAVDEYTTFISGFAHPLTFIVSGAPNGGILVQEQWLDQSTYVNLQSDQREY